MAALGNINKVEPKCKRRSRKRNQEEREKSIVLYRTESIHIRKHRVAYRLLRKCSSSVQWQVYGLVV